MANHRGLITRRMDPLDPWPALLRVDGTRRADNDHGRAVAPCVEDRHGSVHEAHVGMDGGGHRLAGDRGVALRDGDRVLLVQAQKHSRVLVAEIIDDAVVQAAIAGAGIERDIGNVKGAKGFRHHIAAENSAFARRSARRFHARRQRRRLPCVALGGHEFLPDLLVGPVWPDRMRRQLTDRSRPVNWSGLRYSAYVQ